MTPRHLPVRFTPYKIFTASEQKGKGWTSVLTLNASRLTTPQLKGMHWKLLHSKIKKKTKGFILITSISDGLPVENWQLQHQILGPQQQLSQTFVWRNSWKYFMLWQEYWILRTHYFLLHQDLLFCQQNIDSALRFSIRIVTYLITTLFRPVKSTPKSA